MVPSAAPIFCREKQTLMGAYLRAVSDYGRMQSAQILALKNGDGLRFEVQVAAARSQVDRTRTALHLHEANHGC
jgi:hypothetical protein